jgi:membrane fusion protein (multidrug efflux system)
MDSVGQQDRPNNKSHALPGQTIDHRERGFESAADETPAPKAPMSKGKRVIVTIIGLLVVGTLLSGAVLYWLHARQFETTDDAFIDGFQSKVASRVSGQVRALLVGDNDAVKAGQPLLELDPRDYEVSLHQAQASAANAAAQAAQAHADLQAMLANLAQDIAQIHVAEADDTQARQDLARYRASSAGSISRQQFDQSTATAQSMAAKLDSARQAVKARQAQLMSQQAKIDAADASYRQALEVVKNAELQLTYTHITAPVAGRVTQRSVSVGNYVNAGQALLAVVPDNVWVTANYKEIQLTNMRVGQPVIVTVDAYPGQKLHAHVESFQRGTGSFFSTLPAENATGNYVKVVQRVPVKIVFDGDDWRSLPLAPGMSVTPEVTVR